MNDSDLHMSDSGCKHDTHTCTALSTQYFPRALFGSRCRYCDITHRAPCKKSIVSCSPVIPILAVGSTTFTFTSPATSKARNTRSSTPKAYSGKRRAEGLVSWPNNPHSHVMSQTGPSFLTLLENPLTKIKLLLYTPADNAPTVPCRLVEVGEKRHENLGFPIVKTRERSK